ncbi:hypothetical protein PanWU01x14_038060, partial [Parasponia andersonii]
ITGYVVETDVDPVSLFVRSRSRADSQGHIGVVASYLLTKRAKPRPPPLK